MQKRYLKQPNDRVIFIQSLPRTISPSAFFLWRTDNEWTGLWSGRSEIKKTKQIIIDNHKNLLRKGDKRHFQICRTNNDQKACWTRTDWRPVSTILFFALFARPTITPSIRFSFVPVGGASSPLPLPQHLPPTIPYLWTLLIPIQSCCCPATINIKSSSWFLCHFSCPDQWRYFA